MTARNCLSVVTSFFSVSPGPLSNIQLETRCHFVVSEIRRILAECHMRRCRWLKVHLLVGGRALPGSFAIAIVALLRFLCYRKRLELSRLILAELLVEGGRDTSENRYEAAKCVT